MLTTHRFCSFSLYSVKPFSFSPTAEAVEGRFIYAIPEAKEQPSILAPQAYVFRTTSRLSSISITPDGQVSLHTPNTTSFEYKTLDLSSDNSGWLDRAFTSLFGSSGITYISPDTAFYSFESSDQASAKVYVMPLTKDIHETTTIPLSVFSSFSAPTHCISAFNSETNQVVFVDVNEESGIKSLGLTRRSYVGSFIICATYTLGGVEPSEKWMIASPSFDTRPVLLANLRNQLPTPPDSPRPKQRHFESFALPAEGEGEDNGAGNGNVSAPPPAPTERPPNGSHSLTSTPSPPETRRTDIVTRLGAVHIQDRLRAIFGPAIVNGLVATLTVFFTLTLPRLFMLFFHTYPRPRPRIGAPATLPLPPPQNPPSDKPSPETTNETDTQENAPKSDETRPTSPPVEVSLAPEDVNQPSLGVPVASEGEATHNRHRTLSYNGLEWTVPAGTEPLKLLTKCLGGGTSVAGLHIQMNGRTVDSKTIKSVEGGDGAMVLEIARPKGATSQLLVGLRS